jgi:hypothetical protein
VNQSWRDPTAAWWAKASRAAKHIGDAVSLASAYELANPYEIRRENGEQAGEVAFRFRMSRPVPAELLTIIGDAIHNMRSSLDSVAFELALQHLGGAMTDEQERAAQFPICKDRTTFDKFFDRDRPVRKTMYGQRERDTMRCVQPFAFREEGEALGVEWVRSADEEYRVDELARLSHLSNVDKHRRLPLLAWYLDIVYWPGGDPEVTFRTDREPYTAIGDSDVICCMASKSGDRLRVPQPTIELKLALADDPGYPHDLTQVLDRWHQYLVNWVLPRMFAVADGNPPPIAFIR